MRNHYTKNPSCLERSLCTSKSRLAVDREFMYIGSAGQAAGRKAGRADGRVEGAFWSASTDFYCKNEKRVQNIYFFLIVFLTFRNRRSRKYRFLLFKNQFLGTPGDPGNPPEMEHELRLATHQQRAGGQDDGSLNKLPQTMVAFAAKLLLCSHVSLPYICILSDD